MLCGNMEQKRDYRSQMNILQDSPSLRRSLLSPLKGLQLSPIPRALHGGTPKIHIDKPNITNKPLSLKSRGQLRICIQASAGYLTINVIEGKNLNSCSSSRELCSTFVRVSIIPDVTKKLRCKTELVVNSNNPVYDQKFSYELQENDRKKRVLFQVWKKNQEGRKEFLGCMSFGVQNILIRRQSMNGWYYLLPEEYGTKKHLQVHTSRLRLIEKANTNIQSVNKDLQHMTAHTFVIRKAETCGYGFTLVGDFPTKIGRVETGTPADEAGLQAGDCLVRLNGLNVSRSSAEGVAKVVRNSEFIAMQIQRPDKETIDSMDETLSNPLSSTLQSSDVNSRDEDKENRRYPKKGGYFHIRSHPPTIQRAF